MHRYLNFPDPQRRDFFTLQCRLSIKTSEVDVPLQSLFAATEIRCGYLGFYSLHHLSVLQVGNWADHVHVKRLPINIVF